MRNETSGRLALGIVNLRRSVAFCWYDSLWVAQPIHLADSVLSSGPSVGKQRD